jgi:hypothetical protein
MSLFSGATIVEAAKGVKRKDLLCDLCYAPQTKIGTACMTSWHDPSGPIILQTIRELYPFPSLNAICHFGMIPVNTGGAPEALRNLLVSSSSYSIKILAFLLHLLI